MNKDRMILKDGTEIELESSAYLSSLKIKTSSKDDMLEKWNKMSDYNLSSVQFLNSAGFATGIYEDLILVSETSEIQTDGSILTSFHLRQKNDLEKRVDILDGAVNDLGVITSELSEKIGG